MDMTASSMSRSLLAQNVYRVCFPERDNIDVLQDELAAVRRKFFTGKRKPVKIGKSKIVSGFDGKLRGKLSRHGLYWKKNAGKAVLEEAFEQKNGYVVVRRNFQNVIVSRTFFDKSHRWIKSEYFGAGDAVNPQVIFKPVEAFELVERFDWEPERGRYRSTELHPLPFLAGSAEQSLLNARFGEPDFIVSTAEGNFCYCSKKEAQARKRALDDIHDGTLVLMPAWEVKDGALARDSVEEETNLTFSSLEEYAKVEPGQTAQPETPAPAGPPASREAEEFTPAAEAAELSQEKAEDELILEAARKAARKAAGAEALQEEKAAAPEKGPDQGGQSAIPPAALEYRNGKIVERRTEQQNGLTAYIGEYQDGRREGFGSYYYKDGSLCYAGFWKDDKKDGLGVSFRDSDHALHIAKWTNGQPMGMVSLFDKDGNLRYSGRIEDGKKQGAGVSVNQEDGSVFVGRWEDGKLTGPGSSFDKDGRLLYYGGWQDGKRSGHGTEFDANGGIVFDGEWKDGKYHNGILYQKLPGDEPAGEDGPSFEP